MATAANSKEAEAKEPGSTSAPQPCEIVCPPDRHIPVEFHEIYSLVKTGMSVSERTAFEQVAQLVESLYAQEFMLLKRNLKHNFLRFSAGAKDQPLLSCRGGGLPTTAELDAAELKLVADWLQLMAAARFHVLTAAEWELAKADRFMLSLPVEVNWDYYDTRLLRSFWSSSPERRSLRALLPDQLADRVLVCHRGVGVAQASGLYGSQKLELLVEYLLAQPLGKLWRRLRGLPPPPPPPPRALNLTDSTHAARKVVVRRTLRLLMPNAWAVLKNLHKKLHLQEPAFKEVVVLYRADRTSPAARRRMAAAAASASVSAAASSSSAAAASPTKQRQPQGQQQQGQQLLKSPQQQQQQQQQQSKGSSSSSTQQQQQSSSSSAASTSSSGALQRPLEQRQREILSGRNIHIKAFHDIPMADLDVIFADKKVYLKTVSIIQMIVTVVGGLVAAIMALVRGRVIDLNVLWSSLSLVAARCAQVYTSAQAERSKTIQDMVNILYEKTDDAQEGVVSMLLEDMAEQQLKEAILTYALLHHREAELSEAAIDRDCERFLQKNFDLSVDFAVEDALPRLEGWGLVTRVQQRGAAKPKYQAVSVEAAAARLQRHWHAAFKSLSNPPETATFPLSNLVAGQQRAPALNKDSLFRAAADSSSSSSAAPAGRPNHHHQQQQHQGVPGVHQSVGGAGVAAAAPPPPQPAVMVEGALPPLAPSRTGVNAAAAAAAPAGPVVAPAGRKSGGGGGGFFSALGGMGRRKSSKGGDR
ncbi:hypothetical protein Agub_g8937 [Astrephomene gubernaculifera]|uniref:Uncharacterized protein n=1 Tax=Astrephomene gubernaculifera TaxID=47775 RepID=A0AAD3DWV5_9CHLO|nr:hypothetical protein Agub_g8937 [Astrephomene gubernaculifera]